MMKKKGLWLVHQTSFCLKVSGSSLVSVVILMFPQTKNWILANHMGNVTKYQGRVTLRWTSIPSW